jgi:hypothetical protein
VVLVFLVLCANVSSLLLAQYSTRRREFGVCSALGASRGRLLRQAIFENMLLGVIGAIAGVVFAWLLVALSRGVLPEAFLLRTLNPISLNVWALLAAAAFGVAATLAAGVLPAWIGTKPDSTEALRAIERAETQSRAAKATTRVMLVCEIALACTLLVGATLLARSFVNLTRADRGLNTEGVITTWISLPRGSYPDRPARTTATLAIEEAVRAIPGIAAVALSYGLPPDGGSFSWGDWQSDVPGMKPVSATIESYRIGPEFFTLYGVPILAAGRSARRGRRFGDRERAARGAPLARRRSDRAHFSARQKHLPRRRTRPRDQPSIGRRAFGPAGILRALHRRRHLRDDEHPLRRHLSGRRGHPTEDPCHGASVRHRETRAPSGCLRRTARAPRAPPRSRQCLPASRFWPPPGGCSACSASPLV